MLANQSVRIYAFEAVPTTFAALAGSVCRLGLQEKVLPFPAAVRDKAGPTQLTRQFQTKIALLAGYAERTEQNHRRISHPLPSGSR
jgi:hypothetical protein